VVSFSSQSNRPIAREIVHEAREFGGDEDAEILVLRLSGDFCCVTMRIAQPFC